MLSFQEDCLCTKPKFSFMVRFSKVSGWFVQNDWAYFPVYFCPPTRTPPIQAHSDLLVWSYIFNPVVGWCCLQFPKGRGLSVVPRGEQYPIQGTEQVCSGLNKLLIVFCLTSPPKGGLRCSVDTMNEQSDEVEGHHLSPGHIDAEGVAKRGYEICPGLQNKWVVETGAHPPTSQT